MLKLTEEGEEDSVYGFYKFIFVNNIYIVED
jgi:hypothetical protein